MKEITLNNKQLNDLVRHIVKDTVAAIFEDKRKLAAFLETVEDAGLGKLMEEGRTYNYIDTGAFLKKINRKIAGLK